MPQTGLPPAICLMGPTASGKTALAMALHDRLPVEIVSVDAAQVYRGMDIGTAKPSLEERQRVPHRLIDIRDPREIYTVADFSRDARVAMDDITRSGRVPLLVGGTMFYFHALEKGLPDLPGANPELRARLEAEAQLHGWVGLHARLARLDPPRAAKIHPNDPQRLLRALEIIELSGKAASAHRASATTTLPYRLLKVALYPDDRSALHRRIATRFDSMLEQGFLEEVQTLVHLPGLAPNLPALRTVGYRQARLYLSGEINYDEMVNRTVYATRQLAKRQLTWLRSDPAISRFDFLDTDRVAKVRNHLVASLSG